MDRFGMLTSVLGTLERIVAQVRSEHMGLQTSCAEWDVRALLDHVVGGQLIFARAANGERVAGDQRALQSAAPRPVVGDDPLGAFRGARAGLLAAIDRPDIAERTFHFDVDRPGGIALGIMLVEALTHSWDLARAIGVPTGIDPGVAATLLAACEAFITDDLRSDVGTPFFGPRARVDENAPAEDRLAAFLGRAVPATARAGSP
jgi:uncharacterized protein (TIGR03086 family)